MTQTTKPNCCAGQCNYGPGCTKEIEAFYQLANPSLNEEVKEQMASEKESDVEVAAAKWHDFQLISNEVLRDALVTAWGLIANGKAWDDRDTGEWDEARNRWRDEQFHPLLELLKPPVNRYVAARHILEPCDPPPPSKEWEALREAAQEIDGILRLTAPSELARVSTVGIDGVATMRIMDQFSDALIALAALPTPEPQERQSSEGQIERRGDWYAASKENGWSMDEARDDEPLDPLIDAACATVNRRELGINFPTEANTLAAALEPFTQAVKEERFVVRRSCGRYVIDQLNGPTSIAVFDFEQDAKDFAALKNEQEGEK